MKKTGIGLGIAGILLLAAFVITQSGAALPVRAETVAKTEATRSVQLPRTITVIGTGTVSSDPDTAQVNVGVETTGDSVKDATSEAGETMEAIITALTGLGIDEKDIQTSGFSVWADRNRTPDGNLETALAYRVSNTVRVVVRDLDKVSTVLDESIEAGANEIYGVSFRVEETNALESKARKLAVEDARAKAVELAELTGVEVGEVVGVSEVVGTGYMPTNFNLMDASAKGFGGGAGPISPGELDLALSLQVMFAIK